MGGGDLNLKKSWHPVLMSNQKKVWEEEKRALEERKRIDQMMKERAEERQVQELQELQEAAGGRKRQQRVDWMYSGPSSGQQGTTEEMEGYLLGKRRIDGLLKGDENQKLEKAAKEDAFMAVQTANTLRDTATKVREDPMLAIKRQEQAAYEAMMNDPVKRRMLLKAAGGASDVKSPERETKRHKHRHRDDGDRDRDRERHRHRSSRYDDEDRNHRHRSKRVHDENSTHDERKSYRRTRYTSVSDSRSRSRSRSPRRQRERSLSPRRRRSQSREKQYRQRSDSRSPPYSHKKQPDYNVRKVKSWHSGPRNDYRNDVSMDSRNRPSDKQDDAAAKLAAMQQDASSLDEQRQRRLKEIAEREKTQSERENAERARNAKYGGRADFVDRFNRKAGDLSLSDRIGRNGQSRRIVGE